MPSANANASTNSPISSVRGSFHAVSALPRGAAGGAPGSVAGCDSSPWLAGAGARLWGVGVSLGFPVGMSAAADDPRKAAGRVSVVASIGYCAFLAGPPTIGFLGEHYTVLKALTTVAMLLAVAALISPVLAPPDEARGTADPRP